MRWVFFYGAADNVDPESAVKSHVQSKTANLFLDRDASVIIIILQLSVSTMWLSYLYSDIAAV